jgi:hypothetical protein
MDSNNKEKEQNTNKDGTTSTRGPKRNWLDNADYKNGGLLSENRKKAKETAKIKKENSKTPSIRQLKRKSRFNQNNDDDDDGSGGDNDDGDSKPKKKKAKFLTKSHKVQHDNIFSKNFKKNKISNDKKQRK